MYRKSIGFFQIRPGRGDDHGHLRLRPQWAAGHKLDNKTGAELREAGGVQQ